MTEPKTQRTADEDRHPLTASLDSGLGSDGDGSAGTASVLLSAEQLLTATEWVQSGHVRFGRRVVFETRTVEVQVRREELVVETVDAIPGAVGESYRGAALDGPTVQSRVDRAFGPLTILLREEVPEVVLRQQTYERVTVDVVSVEETAVCQDTVRRETATVHTSPSI